METSSASPSTFTRAAASSIASGSPSTRRAISAASATASASALEPRPCRPRTLEEELDGRRAERCDGKPHLAGDVERLTARRQDPHLRDTPRGASTRSAPLPRGRARTRRARRARSASRSRDVTRASGSEPRTSTACASSRTASAAPPARAKSTSQMPSGNSCSSERAVSTASRLLPTPGGPVSVTRRCSCSSAGDLAELVLAADERRRRRGEVAAAPAVDRDGGDRRVVREDRLLQPPKLRPRLEPQLVGEHAPRLLERLERVRLAAAAVERQHQLPPQPLPERVVRERRAERRQRAPDARRARA